MVARRPGRLFVDGCFDPTPSGACSRGADRDDQRLTVPRAQYCKMMLHAAKHTTSSVLGLCIGSTTVRARAARVCSDVAPRSRSVAARAQPKDASADGAENIEISEVVPLFHQEALAPMLEAATAMVDQWAAVRGAPRAPSRAPPASVLTARTCGRQDNKKGQIIGCYHANELLKDENIPPVAQVRARAHRARAAQLEARGSIIDLGPILLYPAQSVADKIDSVCEGHTCLLQISNARLSEPSDHALNVSPTVDTRMQFACLS